MFDANDEIEHAPLLRRDDLAESLADDPFGLGVPGTLCVRRVGEQEIDPAIPELRELPDVRAQPVDGRVVELPVAGVKDAASCRVDADADAVGDGVRHPHELEAERPELERRAVRVDLLQLGGAQQAVLVELRLDEPESQARRPDLLHTSPHAGGTAASRRDPRARGSGARPGSPGRARRRSRGGSDRRRGARRAGNARPASMTIVSPPISKTVMFFPTSPRPPRGMTRNS